MLKSIMSAISRKDGIKMSKAINKLICVFAVLIFILTAGMTASAAEAPYLGYEYNSYGESKAAPLAYTPEAVVDKQSLGIDIVSPTDMVVKGDSLFILDSGASTVIEIDAATYKLKTLYSGFTDQSGAEVKFEGAEGIAVGEDGNFYIADTVGERILVINKQKQVIRSVVCPKSVRPSEDTPFSVTKLLVDPENGDIYAIAESINTGIVKFNKDGEFISFYGINTVTQTAEVLYNFFFNRFLTKEQRDQRSQTSPTNFYNMTFDKDGFIYTVKADALEADSGEVVRCLNYNGINTLSENFVVGDSEVDLLSGFDKKVITLSDVVVDDEGFINLLDMGRGRFYQYTTDGELVSVSGAPGNQEGTFKEACAIEYYGGNIFVLDIQKKNLQIFYPTEYGKAIRSAFVLSKGNDVEKRLDAWEDVLHYSSNSYLPYYGIGSCYDEMGMYKEAMEQFKIAGLSGSYSKAWEQYRKLWMRDNIVWIILGLALIVAATVFIVKAIKKRLVAVNGTAYSALESKYGFPIYTAIHPVDGFEQFKGRRINSYLVGTVIVLLWFVVNTVDFLYSGFAFNRNRVSDYNLFIMLASTFGIFILFVASNWLTSAILGGKGTFKDIYTAVAYSLLPYVVFSLINFGLSHILARRESAFMVLVMAVGLIWTALVLFSAILSVHQYTFFKTIASVVLSVIAMLIIAFLCVLMFALVQQVVTFVTSIASELMVRH